jgi:hypothetical protein
MCDGRDPQVTAKPHQRDPRGGEFTRAPDELEHVFSPRVE